MLLNLHQAAELLGYSVSGLRKLVRRREIRFFQVRSGSPIRFRREWLDDFIDAGSIQPGAPAQVAKRKKPKAAASVSSLDASRFGFDY